MKDFFENAPDLVIDKILENLPIRMAAQTSVLSKQWRRAWLSLKVLSFDKNFWKEQKNSDWQKCSRIISNILLYHDGLVHKFDLSIPFDTSRDRMSHSQWISFLSKNGVREILISKPFSRMDITSYIFRCGEIVRLRLIGCSLNHPPTDFSGFPNLKHLELIGVHFNKPNVFRRLIENCKVLQTLHFFSCFGMDHVVVDLPCLQSLILIGELESLAFRNIRSLKSISLYSFESLTVETFDAVNLLANSCQLQSITFDGHLFKLFVAGGIKRSSSVTFNHLNELCLRSLSLGEFGVLRDLLSMIECCPYIMKLDISVTVRENVGQDIVEFNYNYKLDHLREVIISGITGSSAELKLVEYLLAISTVLENLFLKSGELGIESKLTMSSVLMGFPRASPKARLSFLAN
ncbi:F-box/FBD/LRR-repeat protein At1g13570-like isoform X3 [Silene latifolia]|uniref:F-box/FBD/LRR-repeat protein At1g13570-like isoform X3 n=1 Tax=Silene latifolia TaxID=37657 RepID=UPI003D7813C3